MLIHRAAVDLSIGQDRGEIIGRPSATIVGELLEVVIELCDGPGEQRHRVREVAEVFRVGGPEDPLGELEHQWLIFLGDPVDAHDHSQRVGHSDVLGEVALATELAELVDEGVGDGIDTGLAIGDGPWAEPRVGHVAVVAVLVAVHVDQGFGVDAQGSDELELSIWTED